MKRQYDGPVTPAQAEMLDYWNRVRLETGCCGVQRAALDFGRLRRFLSRIVLLEVHEDQMLAVRLCGSLRCRELGFDPGGKTLGELPQEWAVLLMEGVEWAVTTNKPVAGQVGTSGRDSQRAFVRLPLLDNRGAVRFVLCYDETVIETDAQVSSGVFDTDIHTSEVAIAA